jgi:catechol 2,3-dioxygenase
MDATQTSSSSAPPAVLPAGLRLGAVHLVVADVDRSVAWYQRALGLRVHRHDPAEAELGDGLETVLVLHEDPQARPAGRHAGPVPLRAAASNAGGAGPRGDPAERHAHGIQGASDHETHEAIYLADPDGNGIELAADRPREQWPATSATPAGRRRWPSTTCLARWPARSRPPGSGRACGRATCTCTSATSRRAGVLLRRAGLRGAGDIGSAAFVSAGGYHHHLGINVWQGRGVGPAPAHTAGLREWIAVLPPPRTSTRCASASSAPGTPSRPATGLPGP